MLCSSCGLEVPHPHHPPNDCLQVIVMAVRNLEAQKTKLEDRISVLEGLAKEFRERLNEHQRSHK